MSILQLSIISYSRRGFIKLHYGSSLLLTHLQPRRPPVITMDYVKRCNKIMSQSSHFVPLQKQSYHPVTSFIILRRNQHRKVTHFGLACALHKELTLQTRQCGLPEKGVVSFNGVKIIQTTIATTTTTTTFNDS